MNAHWGWVRTRWAAIGAAIAVTVGGGGLATTFASVSSGERAVYVPITPCRIMDTRPAPDLVGPRPVAIGSGESYAIEVLGAHGNCNLPADAVALVMNVAAINPSAGGYLTVYPNDAARPLAANLNWVGGQPPLSNAVTTDVGGDGKVAFYNYSGTVDVAADVVGYYVDHDHSDLYYTKAEVDASVAAAVATANAAAASANAASAGLAVSKTLRGTANAAKTITASDSFLPVTAAFTAPANMSCSVTSMIQLTAGASLANNNLGPFFRNAVFVNGGAGTFDPIYGHYLVSNGGGSGVYQTSISRTSTMNITAGQSVVFGTYLGSAPSAWTTGTSSFQSNTSYQCSVS